MTAPGEGRACLGCGCTEGHACVEAGEQCAWVVLIDHDGAVCSRCLTLANRVYDVLERLEAHASSPAGTPARAHLIILAEPERPGVEELLEGIERAIRAEAG